MDAEELNELEQLFDRVTELENQGKFDKANAAWTKYESVLDDYLDFGGFSFEDELDYLNANGIELTDSEEQALKEAFDTAVDKNSEESWNNYYDLFYWFMESTDLSFEEFVEGYDVTFTFEEFVEGYDVTFTNEQLEKAKNFYEAAIKLEDENKQDEADNKWQAFYNALGLDSDETDELMAENTVFQAVYKVSGGKIVLSTDKADYEGATPKQLTAEEKALHQKIWLKVTKIIPSDYIKYLEKLELGTDGEGGVAASVVQGDSLSKWSMFIDLKDNIKNKTFDTLANETIIHEFGHILTLNSSQLEATSTIKGTYQTDEGISKPNSYINKFYQTFWKGKDLNQKPYERYEKASNQYISDYAATNVEEDMAESFAYFVTRSKYPGQTLAEKKVNFFYDFPELVKLRDTIRKNLGL